VTIPRGANRDPFIAQASGVSTGVVVTAPAREAWTISAMFARLVATATVGGRRINCQVRDGSDVVVGEFAATVDVTAGLTVSLNFRSVPGPATLVNGALVVAANEFVLLPGWDVRFYDFAAVDALDTLAVAVMGDKDIIA
jgi:hypothetical protein